MTEINPDVDYHWLVPKIERIRDEANESDWANEKNPQVASCGFTPWMKINVAVPTTGGMAATPGNGVSLV